MIGEDRYEFVLVLRLEQTLDRAGGKLCKGFIGWCKNREILAIRKCIGKPCGLRGGN